MIDTASKTDEYATAFQSRKEHVSAVLKSVARKKLVVAGPGTGKTHLFRSVLEGQGKCLTLTFVNSLVEDLSLELFGLADVKTLHGFARSQLSRFTKKPVGVFPKLSEVIQQDSAVLLGNSISIDQLFYNRDDSNDLLAFYKARRRYYDYFGFTDIVYNAVLCFEQDNHKIPCYGQVLVDEFQDFNTLEVSLIDLLATRSPVLLAGDDDQALYETLKSASPRHIRERYACETQDYGRFNLPFCSRSTRVIVDATNDVITRAQENGLLAERIPKEFQYFPCAQKDAIGDANPHIVYSQIYAKQISWFIQKQLVEITREVRDKYTVLVLSPMRKQCQANSRALRAKGFRNVHFDQKGDVTEPVLLDGLKLLLQDEHCNLGWRIVAKVLLEGPQFEALLRQTHGEVEWPRLGDVVDPALRKKVRTLLTALRKVRDSKSLSDDEVPEFLRQVGIDACGLAVDSLREELGEPKKDQVAPGIRGIPIETTTFQSSKGLAADYVFITHFDDRYCVRDKEAGMTDQDVCGFVVALTRARRRLYLLSTDSSKIPTFLSWIAPERIYEIKARDSGSA